jgi:hypothetical protein
MRRLTFAMALPLAVVLVALLPGPAVVAADPDDADVAILEGIRTAHHPGFDRVVFEFSGAVFDEPPVGWTTSLWMDTAGPEQRAWVAGRAFVWVQFFPAWGIELEPCCTTTYGPEDRALDLPNVTEIMQLGGWEGYLPFGIGVMERTRVIRATTLLHPLRFVIDIGTAFDKMRTPITFWDRERHAWTHVDRWIPDSGSVVHMARSALHRLFAGPTIAERHAGVQFIASGANRFRDLSVSDAGVARLTLKGGCDTHGSSRTIATEIMRTLKAIDGIEWVKILDPHGRTQHPTGLSDSIPACLAS